VIRSTMLALKRNDRSGLSTVFPSSTTCFRYWT
jgi:hypothetical protein